MVEAGLQARAAGDNIGALAHFQAANQARPDDPWILFRMAEELRHLRRHEEAESALDAALVLSGGPKHRIMLEMGHLAHAMGDRERALLRFQEAGAAAPADPWPSLYAGQMLWRLGRPQEAQPALERAAAPDTPARLPALMHLGHLARELGQHAAALGHFQAAAEIAPDDPWPHLYAGQELRRAGRADEARAALGRVPAGSPARSHAVMELGHVAAGAGTMEEALAHFREAAALLPLDPWPRLHEAAALRAIGRLDHAAATYRAVLEGWPGNYAALVGLGQVARAQGDLTAAEAHLRAATEIDPDAPAAWTELAATLAEGGAEDVALMVLGRFAGGAPQQAEPALLAQVQLHRQAGRFEAALGLLRRLEGPPPGRPDILAEMAQEERRLGRPDAARALLDRALATEPSQLQALMQLAELARTARDLPGAAEAYRRAVAAHPNNPWPRIGLAQVLHDGGALTEALEALDAAAKVAGSAPSGAAVAAKQVELLRQAGHLARARDASRQATAAWPRAFTVWERRLEAELLAGDDAAVEACLAAAPAVTPEEQARLARMRGRAAEAAWRLDEALAAYEAALRLAPRGMPWIHTDAARLKMLRLDLDGARAHMEEVVRHDAAAAALQRRPGRVSSTHYGQILNDYALDAEALDALRRVQQADPAARVPALLGLVRRFPDSVAVAITLMVALRETGALGRHAAPHPGLSPIPRRIGQFWDSGEPPADVRGMMHSWATWHPDHELASFDRRRARAFLRAHYDLATQAAFDRTREPAQQADLFRLAWLYAQGGWYVDSDDRCHAPLSSIAPAGATLVLHQEELGSVCNNIVGAVPQHPVIGRALDMAVASLNGGETEYLWLAGGPGLLTRAVAQALAGGRLSPTTRLGAMAILTQRELNAAAAIHCQASYKATPRHWSQAVFSREGGARGGPARAA